MSPNVFQSLRFLNWVDDHRIVKALLGSPPPVLLFYGLSGAPQGGRRGPTNSFAVPNTVPNKEPMSFNHLDNVDCISYGATGAIGRCIGIFPGS